MQDGEQAGEAHRVMKGGQEEMKVFLLGAAVGYVLGSRAGRARYDQLVRTYRKIADHPAVQGAAGIAQAKISEKIGFGHKSRDLAPHDNGQRGRHEPAVSNL
ncbi:MAG: hypothetical protein GEU98_26390 [Pseudonocardiaceae bacterium]|nr:hypothetical protein [Pseudonocardiaceae bacterium]